MEGGCEGGWEGGGWSEGVRDEVRTSAEEIGECTSAIFTVVPQLVSHQFPGFLQTLHHLLILSTDIL